MECFRVFYPKFNNNIHIGDLIEIDRGNYSHWALCGAIAENNVVWCFHVSKIHNASSRTSTNSRACIRYDKLTDILSRINSISKYRVNNHLNKAAQIFDKDITRMPDIGPVIEMLHKKINEEVEYCPKIKNCEHYVTSWKYGTSFSEHSKSQLNLVNLACATVLLLVLVTGMGWVKCLGAAGLTVAGFTSSKIDIFNIDIVIFIIRTVFTCALLGFVHVYGAIGAIPMVVADAIIFTIPVIGAYYNYSSKRKICAEYNK